MPGTLTLWSPPAILQYTHVMVAHFEGKIIGTTPEYFFRVHTRNAKTNACTI